MKKQWSTNTPTEIGYYWAYEDWGETYAFDFIYVQSLASDSGGIRILSLEHEIANDFSSWQAFYGPINPPKMPFELMENIEKSI